MKRGLIFLSALVLAMMSVMTMTRADPPGGNRGSLQQRIAELEAMVASLQAELEANTVLKLDGYLALDTSDPSRPTARFAGINLQVVNGAGADTDIVIASAKAYLNALNKIGSRRERAHPQTGDV